MKCFKCGTDIALDPLRPLGRSEECPKCGSDVRVCLNCHHYDKNVKWECRETIAEAVREKHRGNFCDSFRPGTGPGGNSQYTTKEDLLKAAEALFGKK